MAGTGEGGIEPQQYSSFLLADCGSVTTTVALFDLVAGVYRLVALADAPSTVGSPWLDISAGIRHAVAEISEVTGRVLLDERRQIIRPEDASGRGVDVFTLTVSAGAPLRAVLVGLLEDVSLNSGQRALSMVYSAECDRICLADRRSQQEQVSAFLELAPDVLFITGGTDGGADDRLMQLLETVEIAMSMQSPAEQPQIVFAGNRELREPVKALLGAVNPVRVAGNVRPHLAVELLGGATQELNRIYIDQKVSTLPQFEEVLAWSDYPPISTVEGFERAIAFHAARTGQPVLGVDLGANHVCLVWADTERVRRVIATDCGPVAMATRWRDPLWLDELASWLTEPIESETICAYLQNRQLYPASFPVDERGLMLEKALARLSLLTAFRHAETLWAGSGAAPRLHHSGHVVIRGKTLTQMWQRNHVVAVLLDALELTGVLSIYMDRYGILPLLGALAPHQPLAAVQIFDGGVLEEVAEVVVPTGKFVSGGPVLEVSLDAQRGGTFTTEVLGGRLAVIPLVPGDQGQLTLTPRDGVDVGAGPGMQRMVSVAGAPGGVVIDARIRPLMSAGGQEPAMRQETVRQWLNSVES